MRELFYLSLLLFVLRFSAFGEDVEDIIVKGNYAFLNNNFKEALDAYRTAEVDMPESAELNYNMGGALHKTGRFEEAVSTYQKALHTKNINVEAMTHYNLGNTYFRMDDFQNAIKSYENSLKLNPDDLDTKFNLELARKKLKEQMQKQEQDQQDQQQQQKEKEDQQDQQQQDQEQQKQNEDQQQQNQQQDQQQKQDEQQQQQQQEEEKEMSKEDAERILNALKDEQDIQKKIKRIKAQGNYSGKDW